MINAYYSYISPGIGYLYNIYTFMMIAYILMSWLPNVRDSFVGIWIGKLVEPYLTPFRKLIPPIGGMLDISPILAFFALRFVALGIDTVFYYIMVKPFQ